MESEPTKDSAKSLKLDTTALISGMAAGAGTFVALRPPHTETQASSVNYEAEGVASALVAAVVLLGVTCAVKNRLSSRSA